MSESLETVRKLWAWSDGEPLPRGEALNERKRLQKELMEIDEDFAFDEIDF
jgi:hypothetical protein